MDKILTFFPIRIIRYFLYNRKIKKKVKNMKRMGIKIKPSPEDLTCLDMIFDGKDFEFSSIRDWIERKM